VRAVEITRAPLAVGATDSVEVADPTPPSSSPISSITVDRLGEALIPPPEHRLTGERLAVLASLAGAAAIVLGGIAMATTLHSSKSDAPATGTAVSPAAKPPSGGVSSSAPRTTAAVSFLAKPSTQRIPFANSAGRIVLAVGPRGRGVLVLQGLRPAAAGSSYVAWLVGRKGRVAGRAGVFSGRDAIVPLTRLVPVGSAVAVSLEHAARKAPSGELRFVARRSGGR
jgi:hypothetical protein